MKRLFIFGVCALGVLCMASCYPEGPDYVHEKDIALTHYDEKADFSTLKTFVIPDSVVYVRGDSNATGLANELKEEILSLVKQNFEAYNYQLLTDEEAEAQTPDFVVTVTAFATPTFSYNSWGNYWGWYPGWDWFGWGGVWGGWYPWYPWYSGGYYYAYDIGTVVIDMLDAKKADKETKRVPVLWTGMVDGILAGNQNYLAERLEKNINQCFIQAPYLKTTK